MSAVRAEHFWRHSGNRYTSTRATFLTTRAIRTGLFVIAHTPLALLGREAALFSTVHAVATLAVALWWASQGRSQRVAAAAAYIVGAEVLWRMTSAHIPWEFGKYSVVVILLVAMLRTRRLNGPKLLVVYFTFLLPSSVLTLFALGPSEAREQLSFNLSGPLLLVTSGWFFSRLQLSPDQVRCLFSALTAPVVGVATLALVSTLSAGELVFTNESNFVTSGGFAPNQVSSILGLGALLSFLGLALYAETWAERILLLGLGYWLAVQGILTFSRGGVYATGAAVLLAVLILMLQRRIRFRILAVLVVTTALTLFVVVPRMEAYTGGAFGERFTSTNSAHRADFWVDDLNTFFRHPVAGVGPGLAKAYRVTVEEAAAHTEFTRLPAEHGILGLAALGLLVSATCRRISNSRGPTQAVFTAGFFAWVFVYMLANAMRLSAAGFIFGLPFARILEHGTPESPRKFGV